MGIQQEGEVLQSIFIQAIDRLTEAQSRANKLCDSNYYEGQKNLDEILEICDEALNNLQTGSTQIQLIQGMIGEAAGGYSETQSILASIIFPTISLANTSAMSNQNAGNIPSGVDVNNLSQINSQQRTHILEGDATGGHGTGRGISGKSEFPPQWSDDEAINYISDIIEDPNSIWLQQNGKPGAKYTKTGKLVRWQIDGIRDGVKIRIIVEPDGKGVITAFPTNIPHNQ